MSDTIAEVNKDTFWTLIDQARGRCGQDLDAAETWLVEQLAAMGPEQAQSFHNIMQGYRDLAYQYGLWSAASILCDGCTDDGFLDFRAWLIYQGKSAYLAALRDPDSLADVPAYGGCCFETLSYVGYYAYEKLTGRDVYQDFDPAGYQALKVELGKDIVYGDGINYPYDLADIPAYVPRLCAKYLTPEQIQDLARSRVCTWNLTSPEVLAARQNVGKSKKIKNRKEIER